MQNEKGSPSEDDNSSSECCKHGSPFIVAGSWNAVYASLDSIKAGIGRVTPRHQNHAQECLKWLSSVLSPKMSRSCDGIPYLFECLEASLALIFGLAVNLEAFTFHMSDQSFGMMARGKERDHGDLFMSYMCRVKPEHLSNLR